MFLFTNSSPTVSDRYMLTGLVEGSRFESNPLRLFDQSKPQRSKPAPFLLQKHLFRLFQHLSESVMSLVQAEPTPDLHPDTLAALAALMLAQAQEAIYLKVCLLWGL